MLVTHGEIDEEMQEELEPVEEEIKTPDDEALELLEGHSPADLKAWASGPFFKAFLAYAQEQKKVFERTLIEGSVLAGMCSVPGFIFKTDESLRGAVAFIGELEQAEDILLALLQEANENLRDKREEEASDGSEES